MNIFVTSNCPKESANWLDDLRANKMFLESVQLLSTYIYKHSEKIHYEHSLYKPTHKNHPCTLWLDKSDDNVRWLMSHTHHLSKRLIPSHKTNIPFNNIKKILKVDDSEILSFNKIDLTFENCTTFKNVPDTIQAYKFFMCEKWTNDIREPKWKQQNSIEPIWY